jgi:glutamate--cysteine ligase
MLQAAPQAKRILLIAESHTRNLFYWQNISVLKKILIAAGFEVRIGSLAEEMIQAQTIQLANNEEILVEPILRKNNHIAVNDFIADVVLLNNDLAEGIPAILRDLQQAIVPPAELGWSLRSKSKHFEYYAEVAKEFAELIKIDSWFISPYFRPCGEINFMQRDGEDCLVKHTEQLLAIIKKKYQEYQINCDPFVIIKADAGTYGMAVMTVRHPDEVKTLNRKQRTKMSTTKGGKPVHQVILQEGVYTFETWGTENSVAEPVVYLWGQQVVGGFYRVHKERGIDENLNAPGMHFEPLAFKKTCHEPIHSAHPDESQNRFYAYGVIARLSMLAAAREMAGTL